MGAQFQLGRGVDRISNENKKRYKACSKYANCTSFNKNDFPKVKLTLEMQVALQQRKQIQDCVFQGTYHGVCSVLFLDIYLDITFS